MNDRSNPEKPHRADDDSNDPEDGLVDHQRFRESLADHHERERAGVSGDPVPDREYGDGTDKCCGTESDKWEREIKSGITAVVLREGKASPEKIASELLLHDVLYMTLGRKRMRIPPEVIDMYAKNTDCLYKTSGGEWVAGSP